ANLAELEVLDFRAHGAIEHQDGLAGAPAQFGFDGRWGNDGVHGRKARNDCDRTPPPGGGRSARASGPGGGGSASANAASLSPHPGLPSAVRPSPFRGGWFRRLILMRPSPALARPADDRSQTPDRRGSWCRNENP